MESSTTTTNSNEADQYSQYRTLSFSAIVALVFGVISIPATLFAVMLTNPGPLLFPFIGLLIGLFAVLKLRNRTDEFIGLGSAKYGLLLSALLFFGGVGMISVSYATEVPEGYSRISFALLQPDPKYPQIPFSPAAQEMVDKPVFIKGYVYPDGQTKNIKQFVLVPDMGTCCFGGQPKLTDMVQVTLADPHRVEYSYFRRSLTGTFRMGQTNAGKVGEVIYQLDADGVK